MKKSKQEEIELLTPLGTKVGVFEIWVVESATPKSNKFCIWSVHITKKEAEGECVMLVNGRVRKYVPRNLSKQTKQTKQKKQKKEKR